MLRRKDVLFVRGKGGGREREWVCMCNQGGKKMNAHP